MESTDAAALNLGEDFENEVCLSNAEVAIILEKQKINYLEQKKTFTRLATGVWRNMKDLSAKLDCSRSRVVECIAVRSKRQSRPCCDSLGQEILWSTRHLLSSSASVYFCSDILLFDTRLIDMLCGVFDCRALQSISFEHDDEVHRLEEFEIACLSNLNPEGAEEAVALIPSLSKHFTDNEIEEILGMISRLTAKIFS